MRPRTRGTWRPQGRHLPCPSRSVTTLRDGWPFRPATWARCTRPSACKIGPAKRSPQRGPVVLGHRHRGPTASGRATPDESGAKGPGVATTTSWPRRAVLARPAAAGPSVWSGTTCHSNRAADFVGSRAPAQTPIGEWARVAVVQTGTTAQRAMPSKRSRRPARPREVNRGGTSRPARCSSERTAPPWSVRHSAPAMAHRASSASDIGSQVRHP